MNLRAYETVSERRKALEKKLGITLSNIGTYSIDEAIASKKNCENMIGVAQIPLGIAGPLAFSTGETCLVPLATTEGALVASVNRGSKAIMESGGVNVSVERVGVTRGPVFRVESIEEGQKLEQYLKTQVSKIKETAEQTSSHLTFKGYSVVPAGKYRYVRFVFDTQEAMGLNMITIATDAIVRLIKKDTNIDCIALSGNFCVDKKPSWQNSINGRGYRVQAEITISSEILTKVLKTTAQTAYEVWLAKCMIGSALSGSMGFNAQFANVIAALFIATGQDPAHVTEGSIGMTTTEIVNNDLYVSVNLPDLLIGTVGGGTGLATQQESLSLMGLDKGQEGKRSEQFAKIIAATVLAGELSLLASLEQGTLAQAHVRLGRGITL